MAKPSIIDANMSVILISRDKRSAVPSKWLFEQYGITIKA